jgi:asparagine synthase (glutamine-hydrolysing)
MCGILGGNIKDWNYQNGIEAMKHRGPDCQRVVNYNLCTLGFARLSIMDLSDRAMQPLTSQDQDVTILFNGEIYGFQELRKKLEKKYEFRTTSDTEVILNAYIEYGDNFIDMIDGMYAIAIYDGRIQQLKLYRDRYGIKPLYYLYKDKKFAFTSELKGFLAASNDESEFKIDNTAIYDYMAYQYIPEPKSMYNEVYKLEPASYIHYDLREKKIAAKGKYWKLHVNTRAHGNRKREDVLSDVRELIKQSVTKQMVADVPVGTFLSGGVDSSIVSYECSRINPNIDSFSIGFVEKKSDESRYAKIVAEKCNINNKLRILSYDDIKNVKGMLQQLYDEPFADTSAYPTRILSELARKDVKVVLTGDGGDELFGGYGRYAIFLNKKADNKFINMYIENAIGKVLPKGNNLRNILLDKFRSELTTYSELVGMFDESKIESWRKLLKIDKDYDLKWYLRKYYHEDLPPMTRMRYLDFKTYLPSDILTKVDRTSMSVSLETRIPFLDRKLVEYVFSLADDECFYGNELKTLLKKAYEGIFPNEILYRKKKGFSIPNNYISQGADTRYVTILKQEWKGVVADVKKR